MAMKITRSARQVKQGFKKSFDAIVDIKSDIAMTRVTIQAAAYAAELTPVDTSNLINSQYRFSQKVGSKWIGGVGYTANYAEYVHDGGEKNWQKASAEAEFLTKVFTRNYDKLIKIAAKVYRS